VGESIIDSSLKIGALHDLSFGLDQLLAEAFHERCRAFLSRGLAGSRRTAAYLVLDGVEGADTPDGLFRQRR
jgi:hypothetical protein